MQLTNKRKVGRFINPSTGRPVNIYQARRVGRSEDMTFYFYRGKKQFVSDRDFYSKWVIK
jgi:hypothetical protein